MHIFEREIRGRRYRIAATSRRVRGREQPVSRQISLGPVEDDRPVIPARCEQIGYRRVGDVGALVAVADEVGVLSAFDEVAPGDGETPSLGEMVLAVALQRVCGPGSKRQLPEFLASCLPVFSVMKSGLFTGQAFHRATRGVDNAVYEAVQRSIAREAVRHFGLSTEVLAYDTTNFDTFIDSESAVSLARRGKAKSKRSDLRVVGLVMMTSSTGSVPLFHRTYAGNSNDTVVLAQTLEALAWLQADLGDGGRTLVRDGGFYSEQLELELKGIGYHSVTSLPLNCGAAQAALAKAVGKLQPLAGKLSKVRVHKTRQSVGPLDRTLVVVESPELLKGQLRGMNGALAKARKQLSAWSERIDTQRQGTARGRHLTESSLSKKVAELLKKEWLSEFVEVNISSDSEGLVLSYTVDEVAREAFIERRLGKRVLLTDQHDWSPERIVRAFRSQWHVERAFRRMKKGDVSPWGPSFQWTDDSLRAHTFATVLGLQLASLAALRLKEAGLQTTVKGALNLLAGIRLSHLRERPVGKGRPRDVFIPPRLNSDQRRVLQIFRLDRWSSIFSATR